MFATFRLRAPTSAATRLRSSSAPGEAGRSFDDIAGRVEQLEALGVSRVILSPLPGDQLDALAESLADRFGMAV